MFPAAILFDAGETRVVVHVARARAVAQLARGVTDLRRVDLLVRVGLEISGMAARAVGLVGGLRPRRHLAVSLVASSAARIARVIARVGGRRMPEGVGPPSRSRVAVIAIRSRDEVL